MDIDFFPSELVASQKKESEGGKSIVEQSNKSEKIRLTNLLDKQINFPVEFSISTTSLSLEISLPFNEFFLESFAKILYGLYNKLGYLFSYLDYQIKFQNLPKEINENIVSEYLDFLILNPFLWKKQKNLRLLLEQWNLPKKINLRSNILYLPLVIDKDLSSLRSDILTFKKVLNDIGLNKISLTSSQIKKKSVPKKEKEKLIQERKINEPATIEKINQPQQKVKENESQERPKLKKNPLNKDILASWQEKKLVELSVHTKFSALDGISSPDEYVKAALEKNYQALAITDHYSVQAFPEFWHYRNPNLKLIYGCELEVLEDDFPAHIFNHSNLYREEFWKKPIESLTYCVFDLETTGFFSEYNEIIELGYVIWKNGQLLENEGKEYLIRPKSPISQELFLAWYTDINPQELQKSPFIEKVLPLIKKHWESQGVQILVAHNARNFDFSFLNKVWKKCFGKEFPYPIVDTLPLSWLVLTERKSYSLEKLSQSARKGKIKQTHRALGDSELLAELLSKLVKQLKEEKGVEQWIQVKELVKVNKFFPNRGYRVKVLARNQEGLHDLYQLITLSHTESFFRNPRIFRTELVKRRKNLLLGAAGGREGEIFALFSSFNSEAKRKERMKFYDYVEINAPSNFHHLWLNGQIKENELKKILEEIIQTAKSLNIPAAVAHNVHYCQPEQKAVKEIIVANEGMNGSKHSLYRYATLDGKEDRFKNLPEEHLRREEEIIKDWSFLNDSQLMEEVIFANPQTIIDKVEDIIISDEQIKYPSFPQAQQELEQAFQAKAKEIFGKDLPTQVQERIDKEWKIIKKSYLSIYWLAYKIVQKTHSDGQFIGSRGSVGCSFIAYLCQITDLNPLPPYKFCHSCQYFEPYLSESRTFSCYDYEELTNCPNCGSSLKMEGHNLPIETFFGWSGEKVPDIDLNFSGEYQRTAHDYVRELIGEKYVYRIGTINKLSQQTAEISLREYKNLRKELNSQFNPYTNNEAWLIEQLKGIKRTTGQHPGGLLVIPHEINIHDYTPLNYPADNLNSEWLTTHFEYSFLAKLFLKLDILGHDEPTILQKLFELSGKDLNSIEFSDQQVMKIFTEGDTLGVPEFGTDFVKKNLLKPLRPTKFSELVQISGFSHGTNVWTQNQQSYWKEGDLSLEELIACREDIWTFLESQGLEKKNSFIASEYIRKGNWSKLHETIKQKIREKLSLGGENIDQEIEKVTAIVNKVSEDSSPQANQEIKEPMEKLIAHRKEAMQKIEKELEIDPTKKAKLSRNWRKQILTTSKGEKYYNILSKIQYIFPKPHAISYTITAWRTAYYKAYFPQAFYSVLLTYHATVYDIWLMTLDSRAITFRLESLLKTINIAKNSEKELLSIIRVLWQLSKDKNEALKNSLSELAAEQKKEKLDSLLIERKKNGIQRLQVIDIEGALKNFKTNLINNLEDKEEKELSSIIKLFQQLKVTEKELKPKVDGLPWKEELKKKFLKEVSRGTNFREWKLTTKERELFFTLKVILEIEMKGYIFPRGVDFNNSEVKNFKIENNKILIPFTAVNGIGEKAGEKITAYRQEKGKIVNWKEELEKLLNKNHLEQLENLANYNLIIDE